MSQLASKPRAARPMRAPRSSRPALHVVTARVDQASGGAFAAFCLALLAAGLIGVLMLNTSLAKGAFDLRDLQRQSAALDARLGTLQKTIDHESSPTQLARRAAAMGMVPAQDPAFLRLSDGKVLGVASPAKADPSFAVITSPTSAATRSTPSPKPATPVAKPTAKPTSSSSVKPAPTAKPAP
ncbi:MAG: hypothetical protein ACK5MP_08345 [Nostocoides sp.]